MKPDLCITFRFIQPYPLFHGRRDADQAEWPPSPLRAFQAILNAASMRMRGHPLTPEVRRALQAIELLKPHIVAPRATESDVGYRAYVPHNQADLVSAAWHRGNMDESIAKHRIEKDYRPMRVETLGDDLPTVHYVYSLERTTLDPGELFAAIRPAVRSVTHLGWGIDQVAADATLVNATPAIVGERWKAFDRGSTRLRCPRTGSLAALEQRHDRFLNRLRDGQWTPVPPLAAMDLVSYRRDNDPVPLPFVVFKLLDGNEEPARYAHARFIHIAGMMRHRAIDVMTRANADPDFINRVVRGKRDESTPDIEHKQFSYVPLPSIGHAHADAVIRNVMVIAPIGMDDELKRLADRLEGQMLVAEGDAGECTADSSPADSYRAELRRFLAPEGRFIDTHYLGTSTVWRTVTPVILPGHNDKKADKTEALIQRSLKQAGVESPCHFTWQSVPFFKNCLSAYKYDRDGRHTGYHRPAHLKSLTAIHVELTFDHPVSGPLTLGAGRHCGFGLMAAVDDVG